MSLIQWGLVVCAGFLILYGLLALALVLAGRRTDARALAGFVPDCAVLFARLIRDPTVSRWRKLVLIPLAAYLAMPFDLIPDFIPVAGQLDDALVVAFALRADPPRAPTPGLVIPPPAGRARRTRWTRPSAGGASGT